MRRKNELSKRSFSNFGFSTILIAFVMICIVTFSALALMMANSDYKLSKKVADRTSRYYLAEKEANQRLLQIDMLLADAYAKSSNRTTYYAIARKKLKAADLAIELNDTSSSTLGVSYCINISDNQTLNVELDIVYPPDSGGSYYALEQWKTVTAVIEDTQEPLKLMGND